MPTLDELVSLALGWGSPAMEAAITLRDLGEPGLNAVITAIRGVHEQQSSIHLEQVIASVRDPALFPTLIALLDEPVFDLMYPAFEALGQSRDPRVLALLTQRAVDPQRGETRRSIAADAMGELGDRQAIPTLLEVVDRAVDEEEYYLAVAAVIALAQLGNHERAALPMAWACAHDDAMVQMRSASALEYVVGPGLIRTLRTVVRDPKSDRDAQWSVFRALCYLGTREALGELVALAEHEEPDVTVQVPWRVNDVAGTDFDDDTSAEELLAWWDTNQERFTEGVCFRLGVPIQVHDVIELLEEPHWRGSIVSELKMITGINFAPDLFVDVRDQDCLGAARRWWSTQGAGQFKPGRLYKYGYEQDIRVLA